MTKRDKEIQNEIADLLVSYGFEEDFSYKPKNILYKLLKKLWFKSKFLQRKIPDYRSIIKVEKVDRPGYKRYFFIRNPDTGLYDTEIYLFDREVSYKNQVIFYKEHFFLKEFANNQNTVIIPKKSDDLNELVAKFINNLRSPLIKKLNRENSIDRILSQD